MLAHLKFIVAATWLWLRRDLHNFDFTQEPETQKRFRKWFIRGIHAMEYNPYTQWRYHLKMIWVWALSCIPILILFFGFPPAWVRWGLLITLLYSLYANFISEMTALHAAWAALRGDQVHAEGELSNTADAISQLEQRVERLTEEIQKDPRNGKD